MPDSTERPEPVDIDEDDLVHDPCRPIVVPGGPDVYISCGRMRTPDGRQILDTGGNSG